MADNTSAVSGPDENGAPDIAAVADTGARSPGGGTGKFLYAVAVAWSLFQLWYASPLPFYFEILIFNATQARAIHLAFAIFLAFTAFPGIIRRTSALTVFGVAYVVAGAVLLVYAASLQIAGDPQWLIFAVMGVLALMAAWSASRPAPLDRFPWPTG
jgi:TRAP-type uncharacterized transport system fused permease subunit